MRLPPKAAGKFTAEQVRRQAGRPSVRARAAAEKLRLAPRIEREAPEELRAVLWEGQAWWTEFADACEWLRSVTGNKLEALPSPHANPRQWVAFATAYPSAWRTFIKRALRCPLPSATTNTIDHSNPSPSATGSTTVAPGTDATGSTTVPPGTFAPGSLSLVGVLAVDSTGTIVPSTTTTRHPCSDCPMTFATRPALLPHASRIHNWRNPVAKRVDTAWCPCCLAHFHVPRRAIQHVQLSAPKCRKWVLSWLPELGNEALEGVTKINREAACAEKGMRYTEARLPSVRMPGPVPESVAAGSGTF